MRCHLRSKGVRFGLLAGCTEDNLPLARSPRKVSNVGRICFCPGSAIRHEFTWLYSRPLGHLDGETLKSPRRPFLVNLTAPSARRKRGPVSRDFPRFTLHCFRMPDKEQASGEDTEFSVGTVTGHHARLGTRLRAQLCRGHYFKRLNSTSFQGTTRTDECSLGLIREFFR